ncbi:MAG: phospholipase D family protein [Myxococcota bacterium]|nr:phospholipase D family protein [Myxococcota bacterium]
MAALVGCAPTVVERGVERDPRIVSRSHAPADSGPLAELARSAVERGGGDPGFILLDDNEDALRQRLRLVDAATVSVDLQTYLWSDDATGRLLARRLLAAADRGVRVRLLVDDFLAGDGRDAASVALHENVSIRYYNPWPSRRVGALPVVLGWLTHPELNHRMHNKVLIADGRAAVAGGRNVADEYFGLNPRLNFRDVDVLTVGPTVAGLAEAFDDYWNDEWSVPIHQLRERPGEAALDVAREEILAVSEADRERLTRFAESPAHGVDVLPLLERLRFGLGEAVQDDPGAARAGGAPDQVFLSLDRLLEGIERELVIISAYFVPDAEVVAYFGELTSRGIEVRVITNSLGSNNHAIASSQYKRMRRPLLEAGVELFEMRHDAAVLAEVNTPPVEARSMVLHAKAVLVDRERAYIGGLNLSPRGVLTNTENGLLIAEPGLVREAAELADSDASPDNAWRVELDHEGRLTWSSSAGTVHRQPARNLWQRIADGVFGWFPLANQI